MNTIISNLIIALISVLSSSCLCIIPLMIYRYKISYHPVAAEKAYRISGYVVLFDFVISFIIIGFCGVASDIICLSVIITDIVCCFVGKYILNYGYKSDYYARLKDMENLFKVFTDTLLDINHDIDSIRFNSYDIKDEVLRAERFEKISKISYISKRFPDVINEFYNDFGCVSEKITKISCDISCFDTEFENIMFLYETSQKYLIEKYRYQIKEMGGAIDKKDYGEIDYSDFVDE